MHYQNYHFVPTWPNSSLTELIFLLYDLPIILVCKLYRWLITYEMVKCQESEAPHSWQNICPPHDVVYNKWNLNLHVDKSSKCLYATTVVTYGSNHLHAAVHFVAFSVKYFSVSQIKLKFPLQYKIKTVKILL